MTAKFFEVVASPADTKAVDGHLIVLACPNDAKALLSTLLVGLPDNIVAGVTTFADRTGFELKEKETMSFDLDPRTRIVVGILPKEEAMFDLLTLARKWLEPFLEAKAGRVLVTQLGASPVPVADALVSALVAQSFKFKKYGEKPDKKPKRPKLSLVFTPSEGDAAAVTAAARRAEATTQGTNMVRRLVMMAGNDLTRKRFRKQAEEIATADGTTFSFISLDELRKMKAGAFVAVAQGSPHEDAGIVKLEYTPKAKSKKRSHLVLVGKGVTYDTGGINLKPAQYMYGMHGDMAGAAVAQALVSVAAHEAWPFKVTAYLAVADNAIGEKAYRPNDVVTSLKGTTIEIVHTDAEGRMILSDTLCLASRDKPDLLIDFATLTGACVGAIGTNYSGAFTSRDDFVQAIITAGRHSGERVWPFPLDADYGEALESKVADTKQCRLTGGVDHIEAAHFLKQFVEPSVPWVHLDLSSAEHEGGLAHVATKETGFGVRFARELLFSILGEGRGTDAG